MSGTRASAGTEAELAAQLRVVRLLHTTGAVSAPAALRARVKLDRRPATGMRRRSSPPPRFRLAAATAASGLVAAGFMLGTRSPGAPTVADAAVLAGRAPDVAVPEPAGAAIWIPRVSAAGLAYPYWEDRFGYRALGLRHDTLGGRSRRPSTREAIAASPIRSSPAHRWPPALGSGLRRSAGSGSTPWPPAARSSSPGCATATHACSRAGRRR